NQVVERDRRTNQRQDERGGQAEAPTHQPPRNVRADHKRKQHVVPELVAQAPEWSIGTESRNGVNALKKEEVPKERLHSQVINHAESDHGIAGSTSQISAVRTENTDPGYIPEGGKEQRGQQDDPKSREPSDEISTPGPTAGPHAADYGP